MLHRGSARKVTIHLSEGTRHHLQPLWQAIFGYLHTKHVAGASVSRPSIGFGSDQLINHADSAEAGNPSIRIEFVETPERVDELLPTLYEMVTDGLIEVQDTTIVKAATKSKPVESTAPHERVHGPAKLMRIFLGEADKWHDEPLYDAIVKRLRMLEIAGATVYRGILGYGAKGHTHKESFLHLSKDLPVMITVIDTAQKIDQAAEAVESMLGDGLIVLSDVDIVRLVGKLPLETADVNR